MKSKKVYHCCSTVANYSHIFWQNFKHEYLRSRAYMCLSLSSPFSSSVIVVQMWPLSRYSCCYLGSLHPRNFSLGHSRKTFVKLISSVPNDLTELLSSMLEELFLVLWKLLIFLHLHLDWAEKKTARLFLIYTIKKLAWRP